MGASYCRCRHLLHCVCPGPSSTFSLTEASPVEVIRIGEFSCYDDRRLWYSIVLDSRPYSLSQLLFVASSSLFQIMGASHCRRLLHCACPGPSSTFSLTEASRVFLILRIILSLLSDSVSVGDCRQLPSINDRPL